MNVILKIVKWRLTFVTSILHMQRITFWHAEALLGDKLYRFVRVRVKEEPGVGTATYTLQSPLPG